MRPKASTMFLAYVPLCIILLVSSCSKTTFAFTNETDKEALLAFKSLITQDPFNALESWVDSLHFCQWNGIKCSSRHERVNVLNLSSLELTCSFSPSIANLTFLKVMDLANNGFHGRIPQQIGRLFRLHSLNLQNNSFEGVLPIDIVNCSNLRVLNVGRNNLTGLIPSQMGSMFNLQELSMPYNSFTGPIPVSIGKLSAIRTLSLAGNLLSGRIPDEIKSLSNLMFLELSSNFLTGSVSPLLFNISSLQYIALSSNSLNGTISPSIGFGLPNLRIFRLRGNGFSGQIPVSITNSTELEQLDVGLNEFGGSIPLDFEKLPKLRLLHINSNQLTGDLQSLISNLSTELTSLRLDQNFISGVIPEEIQNLINLENLVLSGNMLTGKIPISIGNLENLHGFEVSNNRLYGSIPSSIGNITLLSILSLGGNMLEGNIPVSLRNCERLIALDISHNQLTGNIPDEIYLSSISLYLNLSWNQLSGKLSTGVGDLKNLGSLDFSNNNLSGNLTDSLGGLTVLDVLYIQGNHFEGTIPESLGDLISARVVDLSRNSLSGPIPGGFSKLPFIQYLNLSFNRLEGEVPVEGIFSNSSAFSIVENKGLCGGLKSIRLPSCPPQKRDKDRSKKHKKLSEDALRILKTGSAFIPIYLVYIISIYYWMVIPKDSVFEMSNPHTLSMSGNSESPLGNQYPKVTYAELLRSTKGFSQANIVGKGRYGTVYKGSLSFSKQAVAVKVINLQQRGAMKSFVAECEALKNARHRNLIKTITACSGIDFQGRDFKALVYEFMPKGSLDSWLHPYPSMQTGKTKYLSFSQRLDIAIDVASAMHYLHNSCETPIIHRDLKPSNILLDEELCARVSDFGLATFLLASAERTKQVCSNEIPGTIGYVALEYGLGGATSTLADVYSYGILLLEMFTAKRPTNKMFKDGYSIRNHVGTSLPDRVMGVVDPFLMLERHMSRRGRYILEECLVSIFQVGVMCSSPSPRDRRDAADVLMQLTAIKKKYMENIIS